MSPLKAAQGAVPQAVLNTLERRVFEATAVNLWRTRQLADLLARFRAHDIRAVTFKGPALAAAAYGHIGHRSSADIDILIDRRCASRARSLLLADGYTLPARRRYFIGSLLHGLYRGAGFDDTLLPTHERVTSVDIHVAFWSWTQGIRLDVDALFERAVAVEIAGEQIATLCPEDLVLVLAIHGMMHGSVYCGW